MSPLRKLSVPGPLNHIMRWMVLKPGYGNEVVAVEWPEECLLDIEHFEKAAQSVENLYELLCCSNCAYYQNGCTSDRALLRYKRLS
jgi:hypothetical protein